MKKIKIKIVEGGGCGPCGDPLPIQQGSINHKTTHNGENEARMHRTTLAHLVADVRVLLDLINDEDDLPEWLETKITKAGDYMSSAARYVSGNLARTHGQLEEKTKNCGCGKDPCITYGKVQEAIDGNAQLVKTMMSNLNVDELEQEQLESLYNLLRSFPSAS